MPLGTWVKQHSFASYRISLWLGMIVVSCVDIWTTCGPETPIQDIVDRCRVWESHADSDVRSFSKPGPDRALPTYMVSDSGCRTEYRMVAAVTTSQSAPDQLETLLRWLLPGPVVPPPPPKPVPSILEQLLQHLLAGAQARKPAPAATTRSSDIESLLQSLLPRNMASATRPRPGPMRRDWATVVCFSCGKVGHSATRCADLNETFPLPAASTNEVR